MTTCQFPYLILNNQGLGLGTATPCYADYGELLTSPEYGVYVAKREKIGRAIDRLFPTPN